MGSAITGALPVAALLMAAAAWVSATPAEARTLCAGEKGMRFSTPNSRIMVHQPSGGFRGVASDIERHAEDIIKMKRRLNDVYVKHTGKDYETIERTLDRDYFMSADDARAFGIVDEVISKRNAVEEKFERLAPVS